MRHLWIAAAALCVPLSHAHAQHSMFIGATDEPTIIAPEVVSTKMGEYSPTVDIKRKELFFMRRTPGEFDYTIYVSRFDGAAWSAPEVVPFSGVHRDAGPYLDPSGDHLFFDSRRPAIGLERNSINLWRTSRDADVWSQPELLRGPSENPPPLNDVGDDEFGPAVDGAGTLYFYSFRQPMRAGARYVSKPADYRSTRLEGGIPDPSAPTFVSYLYVSPDGKTAIMDGRSKTDRSSDIFYSCLGPDGTWSMAARLPVVNTSASEGGGWMTPDGRVLLFSSTRSTAFENTGSSDLYAISTRLLPVPCTDSRTR